ncbi:MAG: helix-turn-helix transcriptional regulator [Candidatus Eisenbacteria bacterium]|nr:helix-turn-helix transcriptional regulator [Candidatus Eisenbacteria bacterium]
MRRRLGLTQAELAERLGLDEGTIRDAERGRRRLAQRTRRLLEALLEAGHEGRAWRREDDSRPPVLSRCTLPTPSHTSRLPGRPAAETSQ